MHVEKLPQLFEDARRLGNEILVLQA